MPVLGVCMAGRDLTGLQRKVVSNERTVYTCVHIQEYSRHQDKLFLESSVNELSFGRSNWFDRVKEEHNACREDVALFDLSAFAKLEVEVST